MIFTYVRWNLEPYGKRRQEREGEWDEVDLGIPVCVADQGPASRRVIEGRYL